jgi:ATP-dependent helicase/nuclease subunit B
MSWPELITEETVFLTPNRRLAAALSKKYQSEQTRLGKKTWKTPSILPFPNWLEKIWRDYLHRDMQTAPILLSSQQETIIWEMILRQSKERDLFYQVSRTAEMAKAAWNTLRQWEVDFETLSGRTEVDSFVTWSTQFAEFCDKYNYIDSASLIHQVITKIQENKITLPKKILLAGFTEFNPQQKKLLDLCKESNCEIIENALDLQEKVCQRIALDDSETELKTMAKFAKTIHDKDPNAKIGCVISNLEDRRDEVIRIFSDVFRKKNSTHLNYFDLPFNISAGKMLSAYPIIHCALQLLKSASQKISIENLISLIRSPFLGEAEQEKILRAKLNNQFKQTYIHPIFLEKIIQDFDSCPALSKRLTAFFKKISEHQDALPLSQWSNIFTDLLDIIAWPGERSINSPEYQIIQHSWIPLLEQFSALDNFLPAQHYQNALHYLIHLASNTVFQPQSPEAPIQILGMLEAVELSFDYLWVMGMDDLAWPTAAKPNPFIPVTLQKTLNMPNANASRELIYCQKITEQLKRSGQHVIFSHARKNEHAALRASALIQDLREIVLSDLQLKEFSSALHDVFQSAQRENYIDTQAPALVGENTIRGGATVFKLQSECPFRAFSEIRLQTKKKETPSLGFDAKDRGIIIHKTLELIWNELKNSTTLNLLSDAELKKLIQKHANKAIYLMKKKSFDTKYLSLELKRVERLVWKWLQIEKKRPPFSVLLNEQDTTATINQLTVKLRIDRVDELEDGQKFIIDYKTRENNSQAYWFEERIAEPQLPLYSMLDPDNTIAIAFAEIHPRSVEFVGVCENDIGIAGIKTLHKIKSAKQTTWNEQIQSWKNILEKLSDDFHQGIAETNPKKEQTCEQCGLQSLCRIYEAESPGSS